MEPKILLEGKDQKYYIAEKDHGKGVTPTSEFVFVREVVPYGFPKKFEEFSAYTTGKCWGGDRTPVINEAKTKALDLIVEQLIGEASEREADFVLARFKYFDNGTGYQIEADTQFLLKR